VASRLTDKQKKEIIAKYAEGKSLRVIASEYGVAPSTIKRICDKDPKTQQIATQKKEQNTLDMLAYMESRKEQAQGVIDDYLKALANPEKIEEATLSQIATALGIVVDKFTKTTAAGEDTLAKLDDVLKKIGGAGNET